MACFPVDGECMSRNEVAFGHLGGGVFSGLRLCLGAGAHRCSSVLGQLATVALLLALPLEALAGATRFSVAETSDLPVHALEDPSAGANVGAIVGGNGLNNAKGKSRNPAAKVIHAASSARRPPPRASHRCGNRHQRHVARW